MINIALFTGAMFVCDSFLSMRDSNLIDCLCKFKIQLVLIFLFILHNILYFRKSKKIEYLNVGYEQIDIYAKKRNIRAYNKSKD